MTRGRRLKILRDALGLESGELAKRAGLSAGTVTNIETDKFGGREASLTAICDALGVARSALDDDQACIEELARLTGVQLRSSTPAGRIALLLEQAGPQRAEAVLRIIEGQVALLLGSPLPPSPPPRAPAPPRPPEPPRDEDDDEPPDRPRPRAGSPSARGDDR